MNSEPLPSPEVTEALRQSEEQFRLLVEGVREYAIFQLDVTGRVVTWNSGAELIKGYSAHEIIGQHFSVFYPPDAKAAGKPAQELKDALANGWVEDEGWRVRADGTQFWANVVITALLDERGKHVGFAKVTRDMTDRRARERSQLMESEERFGSFARHLPGLAWIKDLEGRYTYVNDAAVAAFNAARERIVGHTDADLFPPDIASTFRDNDLRALGAAQGIEVVERLPDPRGMVRHSIVSKFPILDASGRTSLVGGIAIDITDRVLAEDALRDSDRRKNEFLATLSHELRNPLAPIRNAVHLLRADDGETSRSRVYQTLEQQLEHMVHLIDDLLEVSRISTGKVDLQRAPTDLRGVIDSAIDSSRPLIESKRHQLMTRVPPEPVLVVGDPVRLTQVVVNLLNNAAKYTTEGGQIWVELSAAGGDAVIRVRDNGMGVPGEMLPRVFDMFAQVDRTLKRASGGLGIGLALARSLVEMHGGTITVRSRGIDLGSEFEVRLPSTDLPAQAKDGVQTGGADGPLLRVLVVDDSRDGADTLCMVLQAVGVEARASYDGASALGVVRGWLPDVVLLDIGMPGMDGYEVARRMRAEPGLAGIRLVAVTGWGAPQDRDRTQQAGFDDHWVKPVDPSKLHGLLAPRLGHR